jgi:hypothetical protein
MAAKIGRVIRGIEDIEISQQKHSGENRGVVHARLPAGFTKPGNIGRWIVFEPTGRANARPMTGSVETGSP